MTTPIQPDAFGIVANVIADQILRTGAKVWILHCNGDAEKPIVLGLSRGGRKVEKYTHFKRLENFRAAWIPLHVREQVLLGWSHPTKDAAAEHALALTKMWSGVRRQNPDGTFSPPDGITAGEAFRRARGADIDATESEIDGNNTQPPPAESG